MDSVAVSEAVDVGSIPAGSTSLQSIKSPRFREESGALLFR